MPLSHGSTWERLFLLLLIVACGTWSTVTLAASQPDVTITLQVAVGDGVMSTSQPGAITAELRWLGADRIVPLKQSSPGVWQAVVEGPQVRALGVELWRQDGTRPVRVSQGLEMMPLGDATLSWAIAGPQSLEAWRLSRAVVSSDLRQFEDAER